MKGKGKLKVVSLKEKGEDRFIEIKIMAEFDQSTLGELGKLFGEYVDFEIESQQQDLDFEDDSDTARES